MNKKLRAQAPDGDDVRFLFAVFAIAALLLAGCAAPQNQGNTPNGGNAPGGDGVGIANPASKNCVDRGYQSRIEKNSDGSETGLCVFPDGSTCEEWKFYQGNCTYSPDPKGITDKLCTSSGGNWNDCGSACRNAPNGTACTLQCVQQCECGGIAGFRCPAGYECTDYEPAGAADAMGVCKQLLPSPEPSNESTIIDQGNSTANATPS